METNVYNQKGEKVSEIKLADTVFNLPWNSDLVHQVVVAMTANKRTPVAHTKGRGEVSGGAKTLETEGLGKASTVPSGLRSGWAEASPTAQEKTKTIP